MTEAPPSPTSSAARSGAGEPPAPPGWHVDVPLVGPVGWPLTGSLAFIGTVAVLAAVEIVPWAVAGALALGHVLARDHDHRVLREIGEGLGAA